MNIQHLSDVVDKLFTDRLTYVLLLQEIAENFYPERADFTITRTHGNEFAGDLMTSYPVLTRRDLGDQIGQMLRPTNKQWFKMAPEGEEIKDNEGRRWLEQATEVMRRIMYSRPAQFNRATKEADHDFAAFGNCVISCRMNKNMDNILYRNWHLRDVVWSEDEEGKIGLVGRKWKPTCRDMIRLFKDVDPRVIKMNEKTPFKTVNCYHIICAADMYSDNEKGRPYFSIFYDKDHKKILEAVPVWNQEYIIPRWQTVSGSQYAYSPATITALPDARLIQSMTYAILEAGEKAVNPPMVATQDAVRSDVSIYAGGITWVDAEYDEKLGSALRPVTQDLKGLPFGQEMIADSRIMIRDCFYLNKLDLPDRGPEMTAYEVGQRVQEYIRGALPIFEPMEQDYNGGICELTFDVLMRNGAFGSPRDIPESIKHADVQFQFESPLHDAIEEQKGQKFLEGKALLAETVDIDPSAVHVVDSKVALRDALESIGVPAKWMNSETKTDELIKSQVEKEEQAVAIEQMKTGSEAAVNIGQARQQLASV